MANLQAIAASGGFIPSRLPVLFLTLERNRHWWTTEPLLSSGTRVSFPGSKIVWEYYAGQGIEIQWLGTFGEANGYYLSGHENANLRQLLCEVLPLATKRAGGIAWEYLFQFDGGRPPWTSGLSQGTALQVLARSWSRFKEPALLSAAQQALGVFQTAPPTGVRVKTPAGSNYAEYTYAPSDRILNGFIQAVVGLYDFAQITKDPLGLQAVRSRRRRGARGGPPLRHGRLVAVRPVRRIEPQLPRTADRIPPAPVRTDPQRAALQHRPAARAPTPRPRRAPPPQRRPPRPPAAPPRRAPSSARPRRPRARRAPPPPPPTPIAGDQIYCTTAQHFTTDLKTPPVVSLITRTLKGGTRAGVQLSLSKISTVRLTVRQGTRVVATNSAYVGRGKPRLLWGTPSGGGTFNVTLSATDPAGNFATATGTIVVSHH